VALSIKYGHILLYDDTAVKNKYRLPVGIGAVIDGEYFTRIVFQMIASDTQTTTFEWMMEGWKETRGGEGPDVFIQDADAACTLAANTSFRGATLLRCLWHLNKNVKEKLGSVLGSEYAVSSILSVCRYDSTWEQRGCVVPVKKTVSFGASPGVATPSTKALAIILPFVWVPDAMN